MVHILASSWQKPKNPHSFTITQSTFVKENNNKETETEALFYIFCHLQQTTDYFIHPIVGNYSVNSYIKSTYNKQPEINHPNNNNGNLQSAYPVAQSAEQA